MAIVALSVLGIVLEEIEVDNRYLDNKEDNIYTHYLFFQGGGVSSKPHNNSGHEGVEVNIQTIHFIR